MSLEPSLLNDDEVLYVSVGRVLMPNATFKVSEFLDALAQLISENEPEWSEDCEGWFLDGLPCEVLRFNNQGWQRGRVRLRLEFVPQQQKLLKESPRRPQRDDRPRETYAPREEIREDIYARDDVYYRGIDEDY